ncbi:hypothetical protein ACFWCF_12515 [Rhodococcus sp. NPDC060090]|uniref:hypothetical protein n=1 Tax=Rhodococcus sp. NPDC060090 TaxID=3347056 RepID=UPI00365EE7B2
MPGYVLDGAGRVELPRQPLAVTVTALDVPVTVRAITTDGVDAPSVLYPKPGFVVLPRVDSEVVVVATPGNDLGFPQGTVLQATVAVDSSHSLDPDRAELTPLDVSGLHHVELATIAPAGQRLAVAARKTAVDVPLTDLGARARSAARGALGVDRLPENRQVRVEVDVDTTMSMLPLIEDGSIRDVVDLLTGVAAVIGRREELHVNLIGRGATTLPIVELRTAATQVQTSLDSAGLGIGFRSAAVDRSHYTEPTLVFIVTDGVPADHTATVAGVRRRPIVLQSGEANGSLLGNPQELFQTVKSLVSGLTTAESEGAFA